jgi:hypothetical protein
MENNKKNIFRNKCDRCWKTTSSLFEWKDNDFVRSKECFARCGIKAEHKHSLCKKCIEKINTEKDELKKPIKIIKKTLN